MSELKITPEECLKQIPNRFYMTLAAAHRARELAYGATPTIEVQKKSDGKWVNKPSIVALMGISKGNIGLEVLHRRQNRRS